MPPLEPFAYLNITHPHSISTRIALSVLYIYVHITTPPTPFLKHFRAFLKCMYYQNSLLYIYNRLLCCSPMLRNFGVLLERCSRLRSNARGVPLRHAIARQGFIRGGLGAARARESVKKVLHAAGILTHSGNEDGRKEPVKRRGVEHLFASQRLQVQAMSVYLRGWVIIQE